MPRRRVLICDDAVLFGTMLMAWFDDDPDIEVVGTATSAREGLEAAGRLAPDVVLLDHLLPDGRSPEVIPQLRAATPGVAVVLMSGLVEDRLEAAAAEAGAEGWVSKASTQDDLRTVLLRTNVAPDLPG